MEHSTLKLKRSLVKVLVNELIISSLNYHSSLMHSLGLMNKMFRFPITSSISNPRLAIWCLLGS
ncbi:hypothetical protein TorRG33x02_129280 [Trema orientale]|uniref:Uncharacterized protein n=1 Tax=Trema orientale TaxID=63057 RepID=A0A2P5F0R8_TREOI|nr:hypothetical protein TorRG33x02_129280 [Trema orientale]